MTAINPNKVKAVYDACPPHLRGQLADVLEHLDSCARTGHVPEGSIASFLNKQAPHIRDIINQIGEAAETPRLAPFEDKMTPAERFASFGLNPDTSTLIADAMEGQYVMSELQQRMGTDTADEPLSDREILSAAYDAHTQGDSNG